MTVKLFPGPGVAGWDSDFFTATVAEMPAFVYAKSDIAGFSCRKWNVGEEVSVAWLRFAADQDVTVAISAGAEITSATVIPGNAVKKRIVGGKLMLQMKPGSKAVITVNGDTKNLLLVCSLPLRSKPTSFISWNLLLNPATIASSQVTCTNKHNLNEGQYVTFTSTGTLPSVSGGTAVPAGVLSKHERYQVHIVDEWTFTIPNSGTLTAGTGSLTVAPAQWNTPGSALLFPAGSHKIGRLFKLATNSTVYLEEGAVVSGSFDIRSSQHVKLQGNGVVSCDYATRATVVGLPYEQQTLYAAVLGYDGLTFFYDNEVSGLLFVGMPFYFTNEGISQLNNCQLIAPWNFNCDGIDLSGSSDTTKQPLATGCVAFVGDDGVRAESAWFPMTVEDCLVINSNASNVLLGYWGSPYTTNKQTVKNCDLVSFSTISGDSNFRCWVDCLTDDQGRFNIVLKDIRTWDSSRMLFWFENKLYPFGGSQNQLGQMAFVTIDGLTVEKKPDNKSKLLGFSPVSTPHDFTVTKMVVAGIRVYDTNWRDFVDQNSFPYNIVLDTVQSEPLPEQLSPDGVASSIESLLSGWTFPTASYSNGKLSQGLQVAPSQVTVGRTKGDLSRSVSRAKNQLALDRYYQAVLSFNQEVIFSGLEQALADDPLILSSGAFVLLESSNYQHPPQESPNAGSKLVLTFRATDNRRGTSSGTSTRVGSGATSAAVKVAIQNAIYDAVSGNWQQTSINELSSRWGPSRRTDRLRQDRIEWEWGCEISSLSRLESQELEAALCDIPIAVAVPGMPTLFAAAVGFDYSDAPAVAPNRGSLLTITFSVSPNP